MLSALRIVAICLAPTYEERLVHVHVDANALYGFADSLCTLEIKIRVQSSQEDSRACVGHVMSRDVT